ncbi:MAG: tripartite tricarboxylate transporter substrate binding protein [Proteobacteria bacterium]|nr:tripartite tricarboxylate transporter substrate binding protein [Burkholderiales bacterium]
MKRTSNTLWRVVACASVLSLPVVEAGAQAFPSRPVRLVVAFPPGATTDTIARLVQPKLSEALGQPVLIDNRGGAGGNIGAQIVAKAAPDGHTLLGTSVAFAVNVSLFSKAGYAIRDFAPVAMGTLTPNLLFVHPSVKATNLKELLALARREPLSYASSGTGTTTHLAAEVLFRQLNKLDITHVPHTPAAAVTAVLGGQVPIGSTSMPPAVPLAQSGKIRAIAVTSAKRSPAMPDVPTVAELGFPGFADYTWIAFFAPAGTAGAVIEKLNAEINRALTSPEVRERMSVLALDATPMSPAEFEKVLRNDVDRYAKIVKALDLKAD